MKYFIKNMVCHRCKLAVENILCSMNLDNFNVDLGEVELRQGVFSENELIEFKQQLESLGFELINDKKSRYIEQTKTCILEYIRQLSDFHVNGKIKLSTFLSNKIHREYSYLSHLFSAVEGVTIEQYTIAQKIEKVKELLVYDELSLTEIAHRLDYSSVAHLSRQFKKITGLTPSQFKQLRAPEQRIALDKI
ncbi:MAG TPA: AraC family transcriptional regulator [Aeromonadales bacterium]|nr:AraC family transcriptional regulator [Aeromonadales bacterium]